MPKKSEKYEQWEKLWDLVDKQPQILVVNADNVGSKLMQDVRISLREIDSELLFGKNTLIRKGIEHLMKIPKETDDDQENMIKRQKSRPELEELKKLCRLNVGFFFCNGNLGEVQKIIKANRKPAAARQGVYSEVDLVIPPGPTGMDPGQTGFFQALNISTKVVKGNIEIISPVHILAVGRKVTQSEVVLLNKLNILPFSFGLEMVKVYDKGQIQEPEVLAISDADVHASFSKACSHVASICMAVDLPNECSAPHMLIGNFKRLVGLSFLTGYDMPEASELIEILKDPSKVVQQTVTVSEEKPKEEETKKEEEPAEDIGLGGGLFGNDDDDW